MTVPVELPLDIPRTTRRNPSPRAAWGLYQTPGFWQGCIATRAHLANHAATSYERSDHLAAGARLETIHAAVQAGIDPTQLPEFLRWQAGGRTPQ